METIQSTLSRRLPGPFLTQNNTQNIMKLSVYQEQYNVMVRDAIVDSLTLRMREVTRFFIGLQLHRKYSTSAEKYILLNVDSNTNSKKELSSTRTTIITSHLAQFFFFVVLYLCSLRKAELHLLYNCRV